MRVAFGTVLLAITITCGCTSGSDGVRVAGAAAGDAIASTLNSTSTTIDEATSTTIASSTTLPASTTSTTSSTDTAPPPRVRYEVSGTVLEDATHGPMLCYFVFDSLPPQCGNITLVGWDWAAVNSESRNSTTWGRYRVVGTFDAETTTLTLTEPPGPYDPTSNPLPRPSFGTRCPTPQGGWHPIDDATSTDLAAGAATQAVATHPSYAGSWIDGDARTEAGWTDYKRAVLNVLATDDLAEIEQVVRTHWGGALCVAPAAHTVAGLEAIQAEIERSDRQTLTVGVDVSCNCVAMQRTTNDPGVQAYYDAKFGPGVVRIWSFLKPLPS